MPVNGQSEKCMLDFLPLHNIININIMLLRNEFTIVPTIYIDDLPKIHTSQCIQRIHNDNMFQNYGRMLCGNCYAGCSVRMCIYTPCDIYCICDQQIHNEKVYFMNPDEAEMFQKIRSSYQEDIKHPEKRCRLSWVPRTQKWSRFGFADREGSRQLQ